VSSRGATHFVPLDFPLTAHANRWVVSRLLCMDCVLILLFRSVMVRDGHTLCVSLKLKKTATVEDVKAALAGYQPFPGFVLFKLCTVCRASERTYAPAEIVKELPSAPRQTIVVLDQPNRPQPRMDRDTGKRTIERWWRPTFSVVVCREGIHDSRRPHPPRPSDDSEIRSSISQHRHGSCW
jgi:hypothetical protein